MTERRDERWLVQSGRTSLAARTRSGIEDPVVEVEIVRGDTARTLAATILSCTADTCVVSIEGRSTVVRLARHGSGDHAMAGGESFTVTSDAEGNTASRGGNRPEATATSGGPDLDALCAPMPATVSAVLAEPGGDVQAGDTLLRLEAMKMELTIRAPADGRVKTVDCSVGDLVQPGRPLVGLEPQAMSSTDVGRRT